MSACRTSPLLSAAEVDAMAALHAPHAEPTADMRARMQRTGQWEPGQTAGRRWGVACVSLEITQRCNLDCTLCYLSESAEAVRDFPLEEVLRRVDLIHAHYGAGTDVQVSGGEPTLRERGELLAIVRHIKARGLRATLFTNGIKATRELLRELAQAGLTDVAFHVDMTQQRAGYADEAALNALRLAYIERARGLPIGVFFNTTVHTGNFADVPMLTAFFTAHADVVRFASFQLQADTGRGVLGARVGAITQDSVAEHLQRGAGTRLRFNVLMAGHGDCNRSAVMLVVAGRAFDAFADVAFIQRAMRETAGITIDRETPWRGARSLLRAVVRRPALAGAALMWAARFAWRARAELVAARGRVHKLTLFTHNFMDACSLDRERIDACVFMAITQDGPLSMCAYNAQRDKYLLRPLQTAGGEWQPLAVGTDRTGAGAGAGRAGASAFVFPIKVLRGRSREAWLAAHRGGRTAPAKASTTAPMTAQTTTAFPQTEATP